MTYENYIKASLTTFAAKEGLRYGSTDCPLAIAQAIANRIAQGWQGGDWLKVIEDADRVRGTVYKEPYEIEYRGHAFRQLLTAIEDVYHGVAESNINVDGTPGLYYCELHNVTSPWFYKNIIERPDDHPRIAKVGELTFFA
jgi:hypothetical protein